MYLLSERYAKMKHIKTWSKSYLTRVKIYLVTMPNPSASKSARTARKPPTLPKSSSTAPVAESATTTRPTSSWPKSSQLALLKPIPESPQSSLTLFQSSTTSKRLLFRDEIEGTLWTTAHLFYRLQPKRLWKRYSIPHTKDHYYRVRITTHP